MTKELENNVNLFTLVPDLFSVVGKPGYDVSMPQGVDRCKSDILAPPEYYASSQVSRQMQVVHTYPFSRLCAHHLRVQKGSHQKLSMKINSFLANLWPLFWPRTNQITAWSCKYTRFFSSHPLSTLRFENHIKKSVIVKLYRAVGDDSKLKL